MNQSADDEDESEVDSEAERREEAEEAAYQRIYYTTDHSTFDLPTPGIPIKEPFLSSGPVYRTEPGHGGNGLNGGINYHFPAVPKAYVVVDLEAGPLENEPQGATCISRTGHLSGHVNTPEGGKRNCSALLKLGIGSESSDDDVGDSDEGPDNSFSSTSSEEDEGGSIAPLGNPTRSPLSGRSNSDRPQNVDKVGAFVRRGFLGKESKFRDVDERSEGRKSPRVEAAGSDEIIILSDSGESLRILESEVEACNLAKLSSSEDCLILSSCGHISSDESSSPESVVILDDPQLPRVAATHKRWPRLDKPLVPGGFRPSPGKGTSKRSQPLDVLGILDAPPHLGKTTDQRLRTRKGIVATDDPSRSGKGAGKRSSRQENSVERQLSPGGTGNGFYLDKGGGQSPPSDFEVEEDEGERGYISQGILDATSSGVDKPETTKRAAKATPSSRPSSNEGRYFNGISRTRVTDESKCGRCHCLGHSSDVCPELSRLPTCILCGTQGHVCFRCPQKLCFNCDRPGHQSRECADRRQALYAQCLRCGMYGHFEEMCPDQWRQYHLTTEGGRPVTAKKPNLRTLKKTFCYNCGRSGHLGHMCNEPLMTSKRGEKAPMPIVPIVCQYKMMRGKRLNRSGVAKLDDRQVKSGSVKEQKLDAILEDSSSCVQDNPWTGTGGPAKRSKNSFHIPSFYEIKGNLSSKASNRSKGGNGTTSLFPQQSHGNYSGAVLDPVPVADGDAPSNIASIDNSMSVNSRPSSNINLDEDCRKERKRKRKEKLKKKRKRARLARQTPGGQNTPSAMDAEVGGGIKIDVTKRTDGATDRKEDYGCVKIEKIVFPTVSGKRKKKKNDLKLEFKRRKQAISKRTRQYIDDVFRPLNSMNVVNGGGSKKLGKKARRKRNQAVKKQKDHYDRYHYHAPK